MADNRQSIEDMGAKRSGAPDIKQQPERGEHSGASAPEGGLSSAPRFESQREASNEGTSTERSKLAVASLACGLGGLIIFGVILGPVAIVLGGLAHREIRREPRLGGGGLATVGIIIGVIDVTLAAIFFAVGGPQLFT